MEGGGTHKMDSSLSFTASSSGDLRTYLQTEFERRTRHNPRYSLRAYARMLQIDPSALCKILKGKRAITGQMFDHLCGRLSLSEQQRDSLRPRHSGAPVRYRVLDSELFESIADWHHYAILELIQTRNFEPSVSWVAGRLNLPILTVESAVERLQKIGMLEIRATGQWIDRSLDVTTLGTATSTALKRHQRQVLERALEALDNLPVDDRDQSSVTMAADSSLLLEAKEKIKDFRRELAEFLSSSRKKDSVLQLSISLFPVTMKEAPTAAVADAPAAFEPAMNQ
jgi:transcriptional regulator with XRE-family HTH domain